VGLFFDYIFLEMIGGVHILKDPDQVHDVSKKMLGYKLITKQTGEDGQLCRALLINEGINILQEYYLAVLLDRSTGGPVIVASTEGGMDIEEVAEKNPHAILVESVCIARGMTDEQAERIAREGLKLTDTSLIQQAVHQIKNLYGMLIERDATQIEINPFALADNGKLYCVDAKLDFDDGAKYRQREVFDMRDRSVEDARDIQAEAHHLNYIGLDGSIGCMVNGAGLAMVRSYRCRSSFFLYALRLLNIYNVSRRYNFIHLSILSLFCC
jgi:succinyl-CoA synthetase beta subunit